MSDEVRRDLAGVRSELEAEAPEGAVHDPYLASHDGHGDQKKSKKAKKRKASV